MVIVIKWCFFDKLLDLEDLFDYENICDGKKVKLALYKLRSEEHTSELQSPC